MQEVFSKIIEELEELQNYACFPTEWVNEEQSKIHSYYANKLTDILKLTERYNNGWIPVEEELPETDKYILLSFSNFSIPCVGRYEEDENGGAFYVGDDDETCVLQDMFVNAWMHLPTPYQSNGE